MIPINERGILARYIQSPSTQARHQAKLYSLLDWIYRFGFTSPAVLELLWGVDRSVVNRLLRRYEREEVIAEVATFACRDKRVFLLRPKGVRMIEALHNQALKYTTKKSTLNFKTLTHDLMLQAIVALGVKEENYVFFITEKEQEKENLGKKRRFDAIVYDGNELIGLEVEASAKTIPHRLDILKRYEQAVTIENRVSKILCFSHKRRFIMDAERVHNKLFDKGENGLDKQFFDQHVKYIYNKELISILYHKFWLH
ncbi:MULTISPECIES: helix-turn-helix domain-containing protein [unclassified Pseudoalteromonas]|uniref:MarR family transcriptional regulator n=1 Tax=unclassified Pseudoalteromonas TaxID=194690 RepID=UPI0005AA0F37|nr:MULTISPECIES: helix-turn-helix domain-containing protein [unclassified Pseudoalteromonas]